MHTFVFSQSERELEVTRNWVLASLSITASTNPRVNVFKRNEIATMEIPKDTMQKLLRDATFRGLVGAASAGILDYVSISNAYAEGGESMNFILETAIPALRTCIYSVLTSSFYALPLAILLKYLLFKPGQETELLAWLNERDAAHVGPTVVLRKRHLHLTHPAASRETCPSGKMT